MHKRKIVSQTGEGKRKTNESDSGRRPESEGKTKAVEKRWITIKCSLERICKNPQAYAELNQRVLELSKAVFLGALFLNVWAIRQCERSLEQKTSFPMISETLFDRAFLYSVDPKSASRPFVPHFSDRTRNRSGGSDNKIGTGAGEGAGTAIVKEKATVHTATKREKEAQKELHGQAKKMTKYPLLFISNPQMKKKKKEKKKKKKRRKKKKMKKMVPDV